MLDLLLVFLLALPVSRPAEKGCKWTQITDANAGLQVWVQRCDFGYRKVDLFMKGSQLFQRYSDGGDAEPVIDVFALKASETPEAGLARIFAEKTPKAIAQQCKLALYPEQSSRRDIRRYTFVPKVPPKEVEGEVGDPQCGDYGDAPDGIQYFEVQKGARRLLFVRVGQDTPLFDENTLTVLPPAGAAKH